MNVLFACFLLRIFLLLAADEAQPPHVIFIYAADLGWNDVSFHGSPEIPTPNIDALAMSGVTLNNYYAEYLCTPSRAALLTGCYPIRSGLQHYVLLSGQKGGLPLDFTIFPQHMRRLGYATHMVGKWHLGFETEAYLPTNRGFQSFYGYLNGMIDYFDYTNMGPTNLPNQKIYFGIDLHNNTTPVRHMRGKYGPYVFADQAISIIKSHDTSKPLFLYLAQQAVHPGNSYQPQQAPPELVERFKYIKNVDRRIHAGTTAALDETVGTVFQALDDMGMLQNSIVLFVSDNGGNTNAENGAGSNYPLRGGKFSIWEGGIHVPAVIWSPLLELDKPRISKQLMHVTDWLPTIYSAAGGKIEDLGRIDGIDMWQDIIDDLPYGRTNLLNNMDQIFGTSVFRLGDLKLVNGTTGFDINSWYGPSGFEYVRPFSMYQWVFSKGSPVRDILKRNGWWIVWDPDTELYDRASITSSCVQPPPPPSASKCNPTVKPCLFNITADPCEYYDLADKYPITVEKIMGIIQMYNRESAKPKKSVSDPLADPMCHNFTYVPWLEPKNYNECGYAQ